MAGTSGKAVEPNKSEWTYIYLKSRIMDGTFAPGQRLVIDQLRRESEISPIPWRESLRRLEAEGLVQIVPNMGATVMTFDTDAWANTMRLLARLEGLATSLSVGRMSPSDIADARKLNSDMADALANFDPAGFGSLNKQFHEDICSHGDDPRLFELLTKEWNRLELVRRSAFFYAPGRALKSVEEHAELLDLIESGADPNVVEIAARQHELNTLEAVQAHARALALAEQ
jgi:DNA-binding GntR family transcriptional regulator